MTAFIDGRVATEVSLADRGLHYGDGLFETIIVRGGRMRFEALHRARLSLGCARLRLDADIDACFAELQSAAGAGDSVLKLIVTRGDALARGYQTTGEERARRIVLQFPLPALPAGTPDPAQQGIVARLARTVVGENPGLAGMKHLNRLEQVLARQEASAADAAELLMQSSSGLLVSGTMSNVFLVQPQLLVTPAVQRCGVAGVMRAVVLREAQALGLRVEERDVPLDELARTSEIFITNARIGIWPLRLLEGRVLGIGATVRALQARIAGLHA